MSSVRLSALDLAEGKAKSFKIQEGGREVSAFVLNYRGEYVAYLNRCAHVPVPLDYDDDDFLDDRIGLIMCKLHGAVYEPSAGLCVGGPCTGESLVKLKVDWDGPDAILSLDV